MDDPIKKNISEDLIMRRNIDDWKNKFKNAKVCILGLGGIGSNLAVSLARSGVGNLHLVDFDLVEASNLNRQYYNINHIGMKKTDAIKNVIGEINPFINVFCNDIKINEDNLSEIVKGNEDSFESEYICEALDDADSKAMVINGILSSFPQKVVISSSGMAGIGSANDIKTVKKLKNLYICGDQISDYEETEGMMSPRVNICAGHQANILLRLLLEK